ncbi:hypothetical protein ACFLSA_05230 [Bacteroidota bacterium]
MNSTLTSLKRRNGSWIPDLGFSSISVWTLNWEFVIKSAIAQDNTKISVLGMTGEVVEYMPHLRGKGYPAFEQKEDGVHISVLRAQRLYNNHMWPYPLVVKLENVKPALIPPVIETLEAKKSGNDLILRGKLHDMGDEKVLEVGFEYRPYEGFIGDYQTPEHEKRYNKAGSLKVNKTGEFEFKIPHPGEGEWQYRAYTIHPKMKISGNLIGF